MDSTITFNITPKPRRDYTKPTIIFLVFYFLFSALVSYGFLYSPPEEEEDIKGEQNEVKVIEKTSVAENNSEEEFVGDIEVSVSYKEELKDYIDNVLFFVNFTDTLYTLLAEDIANEGAFMELINEGGTSCVYKGYEGNKEELPEELLTKVSNIEKLMDSYCKKIVESSSLMTTYREMTDTNEMLEYLTKIREVNSKAYNESLLIRRICAEISAIID